MSKQSIEKELEAVERFKKFLEDFRRDISDELIHYKKEIENLHYSNVPIEVIHRIENEKAPDIIDELTRLTQRIDDDELGILDKLIDKINKRLDKV